MPRSYETTNYLNLPEGCPTTSPWGTVQDGVKHSDGLYSVSTASHGGTKVYAALNRRIPEAFRLAGGWYEEDVDWAIPALFLAEHFNPEQAEDARRTLRNWRWQAWEAHFGEEIPLEESRHKAEHLFLAAHADDLLTTAAFGDWHPTVPKGMVGVVASVGGHRTGGNYKEIGETMEAAAARHAAGDRFFLVTSERYDTRRENPSGSLVIDPALDGPWCGPSRAARPGC